MLSVPGFQTLSEIYSGVNSIAYRAVRSEDGMLCDERWPPMSARSGERATPTRAEAMAWVDAKLGDHGVLLMTEEEEKV